MYAIYSKEITKQEHYHDGKPFERECECKTEEEAQMIIDDLTELNPMRFYFYGVNVGPTYEWPTEWEGKLI